MDYSYFISPAQYMNEQDKQAYPVTFDSELADLGYTMSYGDKLMDRFTGLEFTNENQFKLNGKWYVGKDHEFHFAIPAIYDGATLENVTANNTATTKDADGTYKFSANSSVIGTEDQITISGTPFLTISNTTDNSTMIDAFDGKTVMVKLDNRTLYHDGNWNTVCLPFALTVSGSTVDGDGIDVRTLANSAFSSGTLTLNFTQAGTVTTMEAGKPYLIKWNADEKDNVNPTFSNVTINKATTPVEATDVDFVGSFSPVSLTAGDMSMLYLGSSNKLYYPTTAFDMGSCRAYFKLKNGLTVGDLAQGARSIVLNFEDEATGIENVNGNVNENGQWTTVDGLRFDGKPTRRGLYIHNGKKVVIK